ncbi:hypothetical protein EYF80_014818 [Liparis tanakae]|uniref:Uncharacterized protein n=1 Tax=Liparis tanakae TaxID=230148 RepID=A0A4Z2IAJ5_9TELE|nr:hypothetical protein EYF80_014818 [Liparis tanakae]
MPRVGIGPSSARSSFRRESYNFKVKSSLVREEVRMKTLWLEQQRMAISVQAPSDSKPMKIYTRVHVEAEARGTEV